MDGTMQIIQGSLENAGYEKRAVAKILNGLASVVKNSPTRLVHLGNTVFMVTPTNPGEVEVHTFSQETPQGLSRNFIDLSKYLKNIGVRKASTYSEDPRFRHISEMTGLPVTVNQTVKVVGEDAKPVYEYVLEM